MKKNNRPDELIAAAAAVLLLIATATGNALVMICISVIGLSGFVFLHRKKADRDKLKQGLMIALLAACIGVLAYALLKLFLPL
jgi:hypothetical protein